MSENVPMVEIPFAEPRSDQPLLAGWTLTVVSKMATGRVGGDEVIFSYSHPEFSHAYLTDNLGKSRAYWDREELMAADRDLLEAIGVGASYVVSEEAWSGPKKSGKFLTGCKVVIYAGYYTYTDFGGFCNSWGATTERGHTVVASELLDREGRSMLTWVNGALPDRRPAINRADQFGAEEMICSLNPR